MVLIQFSDTLDYDLVSSRIILVLITKKSKVRKYTLALVFQTSHLRKNSPSSKIASKIPGNHTDALTVSFWLRIFYNRSIIVGCAIESILTALEYPSVEVWTPDHPKYPQSYSKVGFWLEFTPELATLSRNLILLTVKYNAQIIYICHSKNP